MTAMTPLDASPDGPSPLYGPTDLYLSILIDTNNPDQFDLELHNVTSTNLYELLFKANITDSEWEFGQIAVPDPSTNNLWFLPVNNDAPQKFFRAASGNGYVSVGIYPYFDPMRGRGGDGSSPLSPGE
ncbi:MAG TPA: hypothetical protein VG146_00885 [Verrucomicrobiae bacterium]|nr:hypothetical protein [Verrucomicrobiae bacterium]